MTMLSLFKVLLRVEGAKEITHVQHRPKHTDAANKCAPPLRRRSSRSSDAHPVCTDPLLLHRTTLELPNAAAETQTSQIYEVVVM
jgi:hypothetical protein